MAFTIDLRLRVRRGGVPVYGSGVSQLLRLAEEHASLHAAAQQMGMSYRKALHIVGRAEEGFGQKLLERSVGGVGGGGSQLTPYGKQLVDAFYTLECRVEQALDQYGADFLAAQEQEDRHEDD